MSPGIAALCCAVGIAGLFRLNRERSVQTSGTLWLAVVWLSIVGSRNVGEWQTRAWVDVGNAYMEGSPLDRSILTLLLLAGVVTLVKRGPRVGTILRANLPFLVFFLYCGVSIIWSDYPIVGLKRWFRGMGDIVMVMVILTDPNPAAAFKRVLTRVGFVLLPVSILLVRYFPELGRSYIPWSGATTWTGVAGGKNGLGETCLIYGLAATWCFLVTCRATERGHRKGRLLAQGVAAAMAVYLLLFADSITSLACFMIAGCLMAVVTLGSFARRPVVLHVMVLVVVLVPIAVLFLGVGGGALESMGRDSSLTGRTDIWGIVGRFADNPLLGAGYETFWLGRRLAEITRAHGVFFTQAHNGYLEIYLNLGYVGIALLGLLIVAAYRNIIGRLRLDPGSSSLRLAYLVVAIVYNFSEGAFKMMSSVWVAFLLAGMATPHLRAQRGGVRATMDPPLNDEPVAPPVLA